MWRCAEHNTQHSQCTHQLVLAFSSQHILAGTATQHVTEPYSILSFLPVSGTGYHCTLPTQELHLDCLDISHHHDCLTFCITGLVLSCDVQEYIATLHQQDCLAFCATGLTMSCDMQE